MTTKKTADERLDVMSAWAFGPDGIVEQIKVLQDSILPDADECDALSAELGALYDEYATVRDDARETRNLLGEITDELRDLVEPMAVIEAQASLDAFGINEVTGKPFTVGQTKDRAIVALGDNDEYKALTARKRKLEGQKAGAQAVLADADTALSMYRNRNRALCKQLGDLTARLGQ